MIRQKNILFAAAMFLSMLLPGACKKTAVTPTLYANSTIQTIQRDSQLIILNAAIIQSHLDSTFSSGGPYTVFAATDSAFVAAGWPLSRILAMDPDSLRLLIGYSIVKGKVSGSDLIGFLSQKFTSLNPNYNPQITKNYYGIYFNGNYVKAQIPTGDGIINKINGLSLPPVGNVYQTILNAPNLTICADILGKNLIVGNLQAGGPLYFNSILQYPADSLFQYYSTSFKNMTLFLPSDSAFFASGYTMASIDSINNANPNFLVNNIVAYWVVENEFFTSDFLYTGFLVGGPGGGGGFAPPVNTRFFTNGYPGYMGIRPDGTTLYSFGFTNTVGDNFSEAPSTVGHIVQPNIPASNGVIHIVDSVFHF